MKRWLATVHYTSELGDLDVDYGIDHLEDLHTLIEQGPSYECVQFIEIRLNQRVSTLEETVNKVRKLRTN